MIVNSVLSYYGEVAGQPIPPDSCHLFGGTECHLGQTARAEMGRCLLRHLPRVTYEKQKVKTE